MIFLDFNKSFRHISCSKLNSSHMTPEETESLTDVIAPKRQILVIDDDPLIIRSLQKLLVNHPYQVHTALTCSAARQSIDRNPEIAILLCDQILPDGSGVEFLGEMRVRYPNAVRILMTGVYDKNVALDAVNRGEIYRFLVKPFANEELLAALTQSLDRFSLIAENNRLQRELSLQNEALRHANSQLKSRVEEEKSRIQNLEQENVSWRHACQNMVDLCMEIMQRIDIHLFKHSQRVAQLAVGIGREMGYNDEVLEKLELIGSLHDISLVGCNTTLQAAQREPDTIENPADKEQIIGHPELSSTLVKFLPLPDVVTAISHHHEYFDGSGYPHGLSHEQIPQLAAIVAVADAYDESHLKREFALTAIESAAGTLFNPDIVRALERSLHSQTYQHQLERPALVEELKPGMKLAASIYTSSGMLLVKQNQVLTESIIEKLRIHDQTNKISKTIFVYCNL